MSASFFLKNLPKPNILREFARRYPDLEPGAVEPMLALLKTASEITVRVEAQMARRGISYGKFCLLMQLNVDRAGVSPSDLADRMGVTRATVTGLLDGLEAAGFVRRERPGGDRRSLRACLTGKGQDHLDGLLPAHYRRISDLMACLKASERRTLLALLLKVLGKVPALERGGGR